MVREADETLARQMRQRGGRVSVEEMIRRMCQEGGVREQKVKSGGQRRKISEVSGRIAYYLSRERGLYMAEIARNFGVGTSAIAMAIKKVESGSGN